MTALQPVSEAFGLESLLLWVCANPCRLLHPGFGAFDHIGRILRDDGHPQDFL